MPNPCADEPVNPDRDRLVVRDGVEAGNAELPASLDLQILRVSHVTSQEPCIVSSLSA